jgi:acetyltransferase-like isoleucine patch superfamily enzyme
MIVPIIKYIKHLLPLYGDFMKFSRSRQGFTYLKYVEFRLFKSSYYYPREKNCQIINPRKIFVGINSPVGRTGCYLQGAGNIYIGNYVQFGPNVGIISQNHDLYDQYKSIDRPIKIGDYCWIGMNSVVTAGVELGTRTIVGAGSVVTKSFPDGFCVIAGSPAKIIKYLDKDKFKSWHFEEEYYGFLTRKEFEKKRKKYLDI